MCSEMLFGFKNSNCYLNLKIQNEWWGVNRWIDFTCHFFRVTDAGWIKYAIYCCPINPSFCSKFLHYNLEIARQFFATVKTSH